MANMLQMAESNGHRFAINCESNRRMLSAHFRTIGVLDMTPVMCGFALLFGALEPGNEAYARADLMAVRLHYSYGHSPPYCRAVAPRFKSQKPVHFSAMTSEWARHLVE